MNYAVKFHKKALKDIRKLDKKGTPDHQLRLRVGSYKIVYSIHQDKLIIIIIRVGYIYKK
ncbi:hypothetical protein EPH95_16950 [Salicibibacter halophilus]|uniref:Type II toxin-antitoxin system RelE/ParE family toxin n=1 Tax=Salicibibacter halophilus TaxID=2502791 RepID=A0A514LLC0_9BACI|nr:hypothetical protein [Salicibibacter halophilus]QDI92662.1 hypothetical protein EPH95_16950 [Salicibibacter halophilus]